MICLDDGHVLKIDGQADGMKVQFADVECITVDAAIQFPLRLGPQRFIDKCDREPKDQQQSNRDADDPPP
jgi:hypothetical protein